MKNINFVNLFDLLWLYTKVVQRLPLRAVIEADHEPRQIDAKSHPLVIAPGFAQRVAAIVTF